MDYIRVCYKSSFLKMFLTILEDGGKMTRFWVGLQREHTKLNFPEINTLAPTQLLWFKEFPI